MVSKLENRLAEIYEETNKEVLRYVTTKCKSPNDIDDLMQNIYFSFYKRLKKKGDMYEGNIKYLITIARHEVFKLYGILKMSQDLIPVFSKHNDDEYVSIENEIKTEDVSYNVVLCNEVWEYLKRQDILTFKVFVLYFNNDMKIKDISNELKVSESTVKNRLYRTIKEIRNNYSCESEVKCFERREVL
ncbi:MAG: sigma-70 family RNA polymerase sigma factor [Clostridium sp.]